MSVEWSAYKEHARSKGVMGRELFMVHSVPVLHAGELTNMEQLAEMMGPSTAIQGEHIADLRRIAEAQGLRPDLTVDSPAQSILTDFLREQPMMLEQGVTIDHALAMMKKELCGLQVKQKL